MLPNQDAFRAFLRSGSVRKTGVTGVTGVTVRKINDLAGHTPERRSVTGVTEAVRSDQECSDTDERRAIAEIEAGVSPLYSHVFARLQLTPPPGLSVPRWLQAVDDAGRFLDTFGHQAEAMGWAAADLFGPKGLILSLGGAQVTKLTAKTAVLSSGESFTRGERSA